MDIHSITDCYIDGFSSDKAGLAKLSLTIRGALTIYISLHRREEKMKSVILAAMLLIIAVPVALIAQNSDIQTFLGSNTITSKDTLTSTYGAFVHTNWSQAGIGINLKRVLLVYNKQVLPVSKNFKPDVTTGDINFGTVDSYEVSYKYDTVMAGYIFKFSSRFYPYFGSGTAIRTELVEIHDADASPDVYTVKGKDVTFGTGIVGAYYKVRKRIYVEGSFQFKPLLPFVGVGFTF